MKLTQTSLAFVLIVFISFVSFVGLSADFENRSRQNAPKGLYEEKNSQTIDSSSENNNKPKIKQNIDENNVVDNKPKKTHRHPNSTQTPDSPYSHNDPVENDSKADKSTSTANDKDASVDKNKHSKNTPDNVSSKASSSDSSPIIEKEKRSPHFDKTKIKQDSENKTDNKKSDSSKNKIIKKKTDDSSKKPKKKNRATVKYYRNMTTVRAGAESRTIATVSGNGSVRLVFSRDTKSSAPNLPTFVSVICGANSVYSGAFNTSIGEKFAKTIPYSGTCKIKALVSYPSSKWRGSYNAVNVSYGNVQKVSGKSYSSQAKWKTRPVSKNSNFNLNAPSGLKGFVVMKLTACSSVNGATDKTATNACNGHVKKDVGSSGKVEIKNGGKLIATHYFNINYKKHHDTFTIPVLKLKNKNLSITVKKNSGSSVLVHGTGGSSVIGVY